MSWLFSLLLASSILTADPIAPTRVEREMRPEDPAVFATDVTDRFEQTYPLSSNGRVAVSNINGSITIETWDKDQVKVEAVRTADTKERLDETRIVIDAKSDSLTIKTEYPKRNDGMWNKSSKLVVDYRLTVPKNAVLDEIETINGSINITNSGNVTNAKAVNGQVRALNLRGTAELSTVNGSVVAEFDELPATSKIRLNTVNGQVNLTVPSDINATIKADSLNGSIANDFGLPVRKGKYVGRDMYGRIGTGESSIKLNSLNGGLSIKRRADGRNVNPVVDLLPQKSESDDSDDLDTDSISKMNVDLERANKEAVKAMRKAQTEIEMARPEIEKVTADAMRQSVDAMKITKELMTSTEFKEMRIQADRLRRQMKERFRNVRFLSGPPVIDTKTDSFQVKGVPTVTINAHDAEVSVSGWDKPEIRYMVTRVSDGRRTKPLTVDAKQTGSDVRIDVGAVKDGECEECFGAGEDLRVEVSVPKKSNLRISSHGEVRLENVSGDIRVEGGDEAVSIRDVDGTLAVKNIDGRIRVIGFRGDAVAETNDGEISLEGDFSSLKAGSADGTVILTLPESSDVTVESNTRSVEAVGIQMAFEGGDQLFTYRIGKGGNNVKFSAVDGRLIIRGSSQLRSAN